MSSVPAWMIASASFRSTKSKYCRVAASGAPPMSHLPSTGWPSVGTTDRELLYRKRLLWPLPSRSASRSADSLVVPLQVAVAARLPVPAGDLLAACPFDADLKAGLRESATTEFSTRSKDRMAKNASWSEQYATGQSPTDADDASDERIHVAIASNRKMQR